MNRIVKFICIFFIVFICLQFSSCYNEKNDKLIYSYGEYTCEIIGITEDVEAIIIPKMHDGLRVSKINNNAFKNATSLKTVFYEGTIDDWQKIKIDALSSPMIHAEKMYFLNEDNVYYLVEEVSFDVKELDMNNFSGFDCLKTIHLSEEVKSIKIYSNIEDLLELALDQNFVPVVDDMNHFIGIITRKAVLSHFAKNIKKEI